MINHRMVSSGLVMLLCVSTLASAKAPFADSADAYLGMKPPGAMPEGFAPGRLVDPGTFVMGRGAFSRDGPEFY
jgi:hypothetical protein